MAGEAPVEVFASRAPPASSAARGCPSAGWLPKVGGWEAGVLMQDPSGLHGLGRSLRAQAADLADRPHGADPMGALDKMKWAVRKTDVWQIHQPTLQRACVLKSPSANAPLASSIVACVA